jgi:hypothetical protein
MSVEKLSNFSGGRGQKTFDSRLSGAKDSFADTAAVAVLAAAAALACGGGFIAA